MPLPQKITYTSEDYWNLPEGERAELIDGQLYAMAPPSRIHQEIVSELTQAIGQHIKTHGGDCKVYPAPFAVNLSGNDTTWVEPDISVICDKSKLSPRGCEGAPDWVIEVVSLATQRNDYGIKLFKYRTAGVREYWIVNPITESITVYNWGQQDSSTGQYPFSEEIPVGICPGLVIQVKELLSDFWES